MEPHRPPQDSRIASSEHSDAAAIDRAWLESKALHYVARWEASSASLEQLLERKIREACARSGAEESAAIDLVPEIVEDFRARGYVDDRRYAATRFERLQKQARSNRAIRADLGAKGIASEIIDGLLGSEAESRDRRAAWSVARRKRLGPFCPDPATRVAKREAHLATLARRGFEETLATEIVDASSLPEFD